MLTGLKVFVTLGGPIGAIVWLITMLLGHSEATKKWDKLDRGGYYAANESKPPRPSFSRRKLTGPVLLGISGIILLTLLSFAVQIAPNHIGVIENQATGEMHSIEAGIHFWPMDYRITPFVTKVVSYDLRQQLIEIGGSPAIEHGVQADSNSPGRPIVYFHGRGYASLNPDMVVMLHRRHGPTYVDDWVERVWVAVLKGIQGNKAWDFVGNNRNEFQDMVEVALQSQLVVDGIPLVTVNQLAVIDYALSSEIETYLDQVAQMEFQRQQAEQQIEINEELQAAALIAADTEYNTKKRAAEALAIERTTAADAEALAQVTRAKADAEARKLAAEAEAYRISETYQAEANGIQLIQRSLSDAYIEYTKWREWDGSVPYIVMGNSSAIPFLNIPLE